MRFPRTVLASAVALAAGIAALSGATQGFRAFTTETARRIAVRRHPVPVPPVVVENQAGERFSLSVLRGRWVVVDFVYTRCQDQCEVLDANFARLETMLAKPIAAGSLRLLSISFDPTRDTATELAAYLRRFGGRGPGWQVTRPMQQADLERLERAFGITVIRDDDGGFTHNSAIFVVDPRERLIRILDWRDPARAAREILSELNG
ncbi:MAG: SCO family protein [Gammaproteobacteria bacterium]|nr:SCO family protein [Gammaproteobacteria bacterium]